MAPEKTTEQKGMDAMVGDNLTVKNGQIPFFGLNIQVDETVQSLLSPVLELVTTQIYQRGGGMVRRLFTQGAASVLPGHHAAAVGTGAEMLFRFGMPLADVGLSISRTVRTGVKGMNGLRDEASVLLAANNNMDVSVSNVLTCKYSALCHKRAQVYRQAKRGITGSLIAGISKIPALIIGYNQFHLDRVNEPDMFLKDIPPGSEVARARAQALHDKYEKMQTVNQPDETVVATAATTPNVRGFEIPKEFLDNPLYRAVLWMLDPAALKSMRKPGTQGDFERNLSNAMLLPSITNLITNNLAKRFTGKHANQDVAWDKIKMLESYVARHSARPDHNKVAAMVGDIFEQHARDLGKKYELGGSEYETMVDTIASAVEYGKLHPQAIAEILDDARIVTFGEKDVDFGDIEDVKEELSALKEKYSSRVSEKEFHKTLPLTNEGLVDLYKKIPEDEKPFFTMLIPPEILEKAGVAKEEVKQNRAAGKQVLETELLEMISFLLDTGRAELKAQGVKGKVIDELEALGSQLRRAERSGNGEAFMEQNADYAKKIILSTTASAKKPDELWASFATRDRSEGAGVEEPRPASGRPVSRRTLQERAARKASTEVDSQR